MKILGVECDVSPDGKTHEWYTSEPDMGFTVLATACGSGKQLEVIAHVKNERGHEVNGTLYTGLGYDLKDAERRLGKLITPEHRALFAGLVAAYDAAHG